LVILPDGKTGKPWKGGETRGKTGKKFVVRFTPNRKKILQIRPGLKLTVPKDEPRNLEILLWKRTAFRRAGGHDLARNPVPL